MFGANTKVLIVDDMSTMRKLVKRSVGLLGMTQHEEAADGQIAWTLLNEKKDFGLIISDWNMPNCTGLDFLKRVRADSQFKNLPFILLTAEGEAEQVKEAILAGVDSYVLKPFTHDSLTTKLEQAYKKRITGAK
jgi:two-component system chemotaxis response regulator CheY